MCAVQKYIVFTLTFCGYASLHITRKSFSNIKNDLTDQWHFSEDQLAQLDTVFMISYAIGLYINGMLGDKYGAKKILVLGLFGTGLVFILFPCFKLYHLDRPANFLILWVFNGFCQSTGWPNVVNIMSNWFDPQMDIRIFGLWSANASVGNIMGNLLVSALQYMNISLAVMFLLPSLIVFLSMLLIQCYVSEFPPHRYEETEEDHYKVTIDLKSNTHSEKMSILQICALPNVLIYASAYCFLKTVNYTLFFWLSYYLHENLHIKSSTSDAISSFLDIGGILGGIFIGYLSIRVKYRITISYVMLFCSIIPMLGLLLYRRSNIYLIDVLMTLSGFFLCGPSNIIASAVAAELGKDTPQIESTIVGIIDGTGSIGSGIFQILVPIITTQFGWQAIFLFLPCFILISNLILIPPLRQEHLGSPGSSYLRLDEAY